MYILDKSGKILKEIEETTFSGQSIKERNDLQEWIHNNPKILSSVLGKDEDILIIQKEFSDFDKTKERLDLLAVDKAGNLVLIENKLDDSGRDVTWQALKYASYCSSFNKEQIIKIYQDYLNKKFPNEIKKDAVEEFCSFFEVEKETFEDMALNSGASQRILLIAKNFRPEVTSTVLWLRRKNIDIQCIKFIPYQLDERIIIDIDKIIPTPGTEDYMIKLSQKEREETNMSSSRIKRSSMYEQYWGELLERCKNESLDLYSNRTTSKDSWISAGSGISFISYKFVVGKYFTRIELCMDSKEKSDNKKIFDLLEKDKDSIEKELKEFQLSWERLDDKKASKIAIINPNNNSFEFDNQEHWKDAIIWQIKTMKRFEQVFKKRLELVKNYK